MKDAHRGSGGRRSGGDSKSLGLLATSVRGWCRVCITMLRWAQDGIQHRLPSGVAAVDADPDAIVAVCNRILANRRDALAKHRADIARAPTADSDSEAKKRMQKLVSQVAVLEHLAAHVSDSAPKSARQRAHVMSNPPAPPIDSADLEEADDDDDGSSSGSGSSDSESDSHSGGGGGGGARGGGEASADAAKLKLLLERSGSDISASTLPKGESSSSVKSTSSLPKAESSKSVAATASAATAAKPAPPVVARRSSTDGPVTHKGGSTSPTPSDVVDAVVKSASPPPSAAAAALAERGSETRSSSGSAPGDGSPVVKQKQPQSSSSPAAPAAAAATKDAKDAGGMFSNMRKALARPSLGGLMRGKAKPKATPMFGVPLVEAATAGGGVLPLPLLHGADVLVQRKLVDREGIFRLTGSIATINQIKTLYNNDGSREAYQLMTDESNAHTIAGVLKLWLRELPERLIPNVLLENVGTAARDVDRLVLIIDVIKRLPAHNRVALQKLCWVLHNVWQHREANKMGVRNLSVVFAPFVLGLGRVSELMETLIRFYRFAFGIEPVPESDEALAAIMLEQFGDNTPTLSATAAARAASTASAEDPAPPAEEEVVEEQVEAPIEEVPYEEYGVYGEGEVVDAAADEQQPAEMTDEEAAAAYDAMTDDELRGHLATAMASQDFEMCVYLRDLLQSRATAQQ
jgi:hypothetical protein